jgi:hypothetical protein
LRIAKNRTPAYEPTGKEVFEEETTQPEATRSTAARAS